MSLIKIDPKKTSRAVAFEYLSTQILPMVTLTKTVDVTKIVKFAKKTKNKFNVIMQYVLGMTANSIPEFHYQIDGHTHEMYKSDKVDVDIVAKRKDGNIAFCNIIYDENFDKFKKNYLDATLDCYENNCNHFITNKKQQNALMCSSSLPYTYLDSACNGYSPDFTSPFLGILKYYKKGFKYYSPMSLQFHHLQMDGEHACIFFETLQSNIKKLKI